MSLIRLIILSFLLISSLHAVNFDGLHGNTVDPIDSVKLDPRLKGLRINLSELKHSHGIDHSYKHLEICKPTMNPKQYKRCLQQSLQLFDFNSTTKQARQATIDLAEEIMTNPIEVRSGIIGAKDGKPYKGYLGRYKGQLIEVRITEIAAGKKDLAGKIKTIIGLRQSDWMRKYPSSYNSLLNQVRKAPQVLHGGLSKPVKPIVKKVITPKFQNPVKGVGGKLGGIAGAVVIDCAVSGGITGIMGGDVVEGCVDGLTMTTGQRYIPVLEMGSENAMQPHPSMTEQKILQVNGKEFKFGFVDSLVDSQTMKIVNGPYKDQCIAIKDRIYWVAVECGSLAGHKDTFSLDFLPIPFGY